MDLKWNGEIGPASIIGVVGSLSVLVSIGIVYGRMDTKLDNTTTVAVEAKASALMSQKAESDQSERLGRVETAVTFIVPTLQRIEAKLERPQVPFAGWPPTASQPTPNNR